ncbi:hypothetical protein ATE49_13895 [Elizabethkingia miricola]|uniref:Glycosyltransferase family 1 protein n=1 Tax=Elizabethkingia miricola TaxID=172045 RepID=A0ABY3NDT5_ELIMR|nr:hypothetical protein [Elizabethkingia miricola]OBS13153.1 hypothetical protein ATE49_13895 [Elizabethkingia miricola]TYO89746.1 hypothetical protein LX74_02738 [Elizabethkingia miricola]
MLEKKRVLIISGEAWRDESNGGNVLTNLFTPLMDEFEFAQIYTNPQMPNNSVCKRYYHISEAEVIKSFLTRKPFGNRLELLTYNTDIKSQEKNISLEVSALTKLKRLNFAIFHTIQDVIWRLSKWKTPELEQFIREYNPDIIFAPMYYSLFIHRIDRYVAKLTGKKVISYVSDDHLTYRQFSLSPIYWFNRFMLRRNVIKTAKYYSLLYTMTNEQKEEYEDVLKIPMKVLKKTGDFTVKPLPRINLNEPLVITYGGNLISNRQKTLGALASAIQKINKDSVKIILNIYTQSYVDDKTKSLLHDGRSSFLNGKITMPELHEKYKESDILLHVESFDLKPRLETRLSFSTKIIDLLNAYRCVMAICWKESSPYLYLKSENAAICISDIDLLQQELEYLLINRQTLQEYAEKAWDCGVRNHQKDIVIKDLKDDFNNILSKI